jgi:CheY-like chemotaxis protein
VLVVEDNLINQKVLSRQLSRAGCIIYVASHGGECLAFLENSTFSINAGDRAIPLSLILLDIEMPVIDGLTCIRQIRAQEACHALAAHVPVIAVTANARPEHITAALQSGVDSVVTKPSRFSDLVAQVQQLLGAGQNLV